MTFRFEVLTLFPPMIEGYVRGSILGRALERGLIEVRAVDIRDFSAGKHRVTDDAPYGGGAGMVMKVEPIARAVEASRERLPGARVILLSPRGPTLDQPTARALAQDPAGLVLVCGRYEGVDERVLSVVDAELSIGDYVLTGGELGALVVLDAVARLLPGVLGNARSAATESFEAPLLEHPHYTRPPSWQGLDVPPVLQGGDHRAIERWRRQRSLLLTRQRRPDLFARLLLSDEDRALLAEADAGGGST